MRRAPIPLTSPPRTISPEDPDFPVDVAMAGRPRPLRVAGALPDLSRSVAIVGTRRADPEALDFARRLGEDLARAGVVVVSGGARGVDAAAHHGALSVGGLTVAVLATGFDRAYPPGHEALFGRIAERGALVTEAEDGAPPLKGFFLRRNALIAALVPVVVVVQAPLKSGALSTAAHGRRFGRPILAVPWAPHDLLGEGCVDLLRRGAGVCTSSRDVLSVPALGMGRFPAESPRRPENPNDIAGIDDDGKAIVAVLGPRPRHVDELAARAGLPVGRAQRALLLLLLSGLAEEREGGRYAGRRRGS
jgi:DNA processing protein